MEWLGVLLLYLISGFFKKRQQDQKRKEIESDPSWDSDFQLENEIICAWIKIFNFKFRSLTGSEFHDKSI